MKYYIDEKRVVQAIHEDSVMLPETAYPRWTLVQMESGYRLGDTLPEKQLTVGDYDQAMEAYIAKVRIDRGYTLREPSNFTDSRNARWAQDAVDFILFRDQVLEYGQEVMNHYTSTGEAPTLEAFKLALSMIKCEWSYTE